MNRSMLLAVTTLAAGLQFGCAHPMGGPGVHAQSKPDMAPCTSNLDCRVPVYVSVGAAQECSVQVLFEKVTVAKTWKPRVVWRIEKADPTGDNFEYRFDKDYGVVIKNYDPLTDFDDKGYDGGNERRFKWRSLNGRSYRMEFDYEIRVERRASEADPWTPCTVYDPKIVNDGQ